MLLSESNQYPCSRDKHCLRQGRIKYYLGNVCLARGHIEESLETYSEALELYRQLNPAHLLTACLYYKLGIVETIRQHKDEAR